jgi:phenylalanyl-tRNA synthetase beta chain
MLVPINWLNNYVKIDDMAIDHLEKELIMSGSNTEGVVNLADSFENIVIGKIETIESHPNADTLFVMQVNVGEEKIQIITSATNCSVNDYVPVALHGAVIADGTKIKKGKLRGEVSEGMLCSLEEMGFNKSVIPQKYVHGIYILNGEFTLGEDIKTALKLDDPIIEFEITPNRPDCLSMLGMARETSATFDKSLNLPDLSIQSEIDDVKDCVSIKIEDEDLCSRYAGRVIKDVEIKESPSWLQLSLMKAGVRPTNNVVDITNYSMLEYGQPIHAFDLDTLEGNQIIVRRAKKDEKIVTLDDVERKLTTDNLVICDAKQPVAIAGIMGGDETEVKKNTKNILIEVANFDAKNIRESSKSLGLRSEASSRYEKGISPSIVKDTAERVCHLIEKLGAGTVVKGIVDEYPRKVKVKEVKVRIKRVNDLLGTKISPEDMMAILEKLSIKTVLADNEIIATPPLFRLDLNKEIDFVEEIARIFGYENIEKTLPAGNTWGDKTYSQKLESMSKEILFSNGVSEITTYSFVSPSILDDLRFSEESYLRRFVELENPLGEEFSMMRTTLVANMLKVIKNNHNRNIKEARLFELGNVFVPKQIPVIDEPYEKKRLVISSYGESETFFTVKGILENTLEGLGIEEYRLLKEKNNPTYHPGKCATIESKGKILGTIGEMHPKTMENFDVDERVYMIDLDYDEI